MIIYNDNNNNEKQRQKGLHASAGVIQKSVSYICTLQGGPSPHLPNTGQIMYFLRCRKAPPHGSYCCMYVHYLFNMEIFLFFNLHCAFLPFRVTSNGLKKIKKSTSEMGKIRF